MDNYHNWDVTFEEAYELALFVNESISEKVSFSTFFYCRDFVWLTVISPLKIPGLLWVRAVFEWIF